jgi:endoglucanase
MTAPLSRDLNGTPTDTSRSPLAAVAVAAAAAEAGQPARRDALLGLADRIAQQYPTYYGTAWAALGRIILTTRLFPGCP